MDVEIFEPILLLKQQYCSKLMQRVSKLNTLQNQLIVRQFEVGIDIRRTGETKVKMAQYQQLGYKIDELDKTIMETMKLTLRADRAWRRYRRNFWKKYRDLLESKKVKKCRTAKYRYLAAKMMAFWKMMKVRDRSLKTEAILMDQLAKYEEKERIEREEALLQSAMEAARN